MSQLTFRGSVLKCAELCRPKKGGVYLRIHFASEITVPVMEAMKWDAMPECVEGAKLSGCITSPGKFVLTPNDKELKQYEIELEATEVTDFAVQRIEKKDESVRTELRFVVRSNQVGAEVRIAEWMRLIGGAEAALKVNYHTAVPQQQLPMGDAPRATEEQRQAVMEIPAVPFDSGALAPAALMGGTHQRGRRTPRNPEAEAMADGSAPLEGAQ